MEKIHLTYVNNRLTRVKAPNVFGRYWESKNTFEREDTNNLLPQNNNHMVIMIQHAKWDVKRVLIDLGSFADILFWSTFQGLEKDPHNIGSFQGSLIDLSGKQVQLNGYFAVKTKFGSGVSVRTIEVKYIRRHVPLQHLPWKARSLPSWGGPIHSPLKLKISTT